MPLEIERKFRLKNTNYQKDVVKSEEILQGYICAENGNVTRIRIVDDKLAYLTIKIKSSSNAVPEYEYEIPLEHAQELINFCHGRTVKKRRQHVEYRNRIWHVDRYLGTLTGISIAEIELQSQSDKLQDNDLPPWVGEEIPLFANFSAFRLSRLNQNNIELSEINRVIGL